MQAVEQFRNAMQTIDCSRVVEALHSIDPGVDRETWVRALTAFKAAGGAETDARAWSESGSTYDARAFSDTWRSIKANGGIGPGTLFHMAKEYGWRDNGNRPNPAELERQRQAREAKAASEAEAFRQEQKRTAEIAAQLWQAAAPANDNPYLERKGVKPTDTLRQIDAATASGIMGYAPMAKGEALTGNLLLVPIKREGELVSAELIGANGLKAALYGPGTKAGGYWLTGKANAPAAILIGEGVATALSANMATGTLAAAAFSNTNLKNVTEALCHQHPTAKLVILADLDKATGQPDRHAAAAAQAVNGLLTVPDFGAHRASGDKDFNDLHQVLGLEAVRACIASARSVAAEDTKPWPDPQPLSVKVEPEPYPLDALPHLIRAAVQEVAGFVKAPVALVASSALAAMSLACQAHADVKRAEKLEGPIGLFLLTIADSGERKSTCDGFFTKPIREYEEAQAEAAKPLLKDHEADLGAWEAKRTGIKEKIRHLAKENKPTEGLEADLRDLEHDKPVPPKVPRLLYADATPEALAYGLAKDWPSSGVVSAEAGVVFGSHGMGKESVMRNLATLNQLWDGNSLSISRKTTESFTVRGARLTVALQVQEPTLREFFTRSGALARGTGFLARFLIAWPESTQGQRPFTEAPTNWPALAAFHQRIATILQRPAPIDEEGALTPSMLSMTVEAKQAWVQYHDVIESGLSSGGELYEVRDVASKSADNAARLAALFQLFEVGGGAVGLPAFEGASRIAAWHLNEARRFFGELALPVEMADAARLDSWVIAHCQKERTNTLGKNHARQHGPLRDGARLDAAIRELGQLDRVRLVTDGKRRILQVNPGLLHARSTA